VIVKAIEAGIYHDLGSGSNVDLCVITKGKTQFFRNYVSKNKKMFSMEKAYIFPQGTTSINL
jgi:20S proteasome subunit beta 2